MPPDDAYRDETHTERYRPLVDVARSIVNQVAAGYEVRVEAAAASVFEHPGRIIETSAIVPPDESRALVIAVTDFPGVMIRTASGSEIAFPACGCDACDEDVVSLIDDLEAIVDDECMEWPAR